MKAMSKQEVQRMFPNAQVEARGGAILGGKFILTGYLVRERGTVRALSPYGVSYGTFLSAERALDVMVRAELERVAIGRAA